MSLLRRSDAETADRWQWASMVSLLEAWASVCRSAAREESSTTLLRPTWRLGWTAQGEREAGGVPGYTMKTLQTPRQVEHMLSPLTDRLSRTPPAKILNCEFELAGSR